ncbi:MAG: sulfatase [Bryobacter sp.]|jgi:arylsulfatase A-like enzyme|nr:sulfatase [Bryobacter sp. CoA8 C33]
MFRRDFLTAMAAQTTRTRDLTSDKPNVIWLLADQHRGQAIGANGDPNANTPNLDRLSAGGVNFTAAVSGMPLCCPFRGSLLTGKYPHECVPGHEYPLPKGQPTITTPLREAGYTTAWFGKWHLGGFHERDGRAAKFIVPPDLRGGFDKWVGYENNNSQWDCWVHGGQGQDAFLERLPGYETDALTDLMIDYVRQQAHAQREGRGKPFFACLSVQPPHDPYAAPEQYMSRYNPARIELRPNVPRVARLEAQARRDLAGYYAMIENWDSNIGRLRRVLDQEGISFRTHLMVFSDHGDMHGSHGMFRKMTVHEESIRVPMILGGEQPVYEGRATGRFPVPLNHVDIAPTTLGLCGIEKPAFMRGFDYSGYRLTRRKRGGEPDSAYLQSVVPTGHNHSINKAWRGLVTRDGWKYACFENTSWLLFNLNEDPYEQMNLAHNNAYRAERSKLITRLRAWAADTGDRFAIPAD